MIDQEVKDTIAEVLSYASYEAFHGTTGLGIFINRSTYNPGIHIHHEKDKFYGSYTRPTTIGCSPSLDKLEFIKDLDVESLKTKVSAKLRQARLLEEIKQAAFITIKNYITKTFKLTDDLIESNDIEFREYNTFAIAGITFGYTGTISGKDFIITDFCYTSHEAMYNTVMNITDYFDLKQRSLEP